LEYDKKSNSIIFGSPYMNKILRTLQEVNTVAPKKDTHYIKPHYSFLVHGSIANERNKPAIEIVNSFITLLHQRGTAKQQKEELTSDKIEKTVKKAIQEEFNPAACSPNDDIAAESRTTMHKRISSIIEEIPLLTETLEKPIIDKVTNMPKPQTAKNKNKILKRAFVGAYNLLKTKTDVYKYYNDLKITEIIPTVSTIDQTIEISHVGLNENYKKV
jgi:hypothetical protein